MNRAKRYISIIGVLTLIGIGLFFLNFSEGDVEVKPALVQKDSTVTELNIDYGLNLDSFYVVEKRVQPADFLSDILLNYNVPYPIIHQLSELPDSMFNERRITVGKKYLLLCDRDDQKTAKYFIYRPNEVDYIACYLGDSITVQRGAKEVRTEIRSLGGIIDNSLYVALTENGGDPMLALRMADIMAWSIDFYRIQQGDWFKVVFEEKFVDDEPIGLGKLLAVDFNHEGRDFFGFYFKQDSIHDYFDHEANSLRKAFLKSPLKFSRLTSGYTKRRFHPVQKRWKAHLGTDYAAPTGTPIMATGDGIVIEAKYKKYNGRYVKIRHNGVYTTQYLHMNAIGKNIKPGVFVQQGEVIGFVGSSGLATGPHVCYRFWKNDQQVNHLNEDFPPSEPVAQEHLQRFIKESNLWKKELTEIQFKSDSSSAVIQ